MTESVLNTQYGGEHYKGKAIQPIEYAHANNLSFFQGNVVKYVTRYKDKKGAEDIEKAVHYLQMILEFEYGVKTSFKKEEDISEQECVDYHQKLWKEGTALNERFIQDGDGYIDTHNGEWYPDCSGDWVETSGLDFKTTTAGLCETHIEVLSSYEREDKRYRKAVNTTEYWFCGHSSWGNRVAYKVVKS